MAAAVGGDAFADAACSHTDIKCFGVRVALDQKMSVVVRACYADRVVPQRAPDSGADKSRVYPQVVEERFSIDNAESVKTAQTSALGCEINRALNQILGCHRECRSQTFQKGRIVPPIALGTECQIAKCDSVGPYRAPDRYIADMVHPAAKFDCGCLRAVKLPVSPHIVWFEAAPI